MAHLFLENSLQDQDLSSFIKKQEEDQQDNYEDEEDQEYNEYEAFQGYGEYNAVQGYGGFPVTMIDPNIVNYQMQYGYQPSGFYQGKGNY